MNPSKFRKSLHFLVVAAALVAAIPAHATPTLPNGTYSLPTGDITMSVAGDTLTGTVTFTNGTMTGSLFFYDVTNSKTYTFSTFSAGSCCNPVEVTEYSNAVGNGGQLIFDLASTAITPGNYYVCGTETNYCGGGGDSYAHIYTPDSGSVYVQSGTLQATVAAATPEPSSLVLIGTGLVGLAGVGRRRWMNS